MTMFCPINACCLGTLGTEAVMAKNVFYYLTYAGSIDLDTIKDPMLRKVRVLANLWT